MTHLSRKQEQRFMKRESYKPVDRKMIKINERQQSISQAAAKDSNFQHGTAGKRGWRFGGSLQVGGGHGVGMVTAQLVGALPSDGEMLLLLVIPQPTREQTHPFQPPSAF